MIDRILTHSIYIQDLIGIPRCNTLPPQDNLPDKLESMEIRADQIQMDKDRLVECVDYLNEQYQLLGISQYIRLI